MPSSDAEAEDATRAGNALSILLEKVTSWPEGRLISCMVLRGERFATCTAMLRERSTVGRPAEPIRH